MTSEEESKTHNPSPKFMDLFSDSSDEIDAVDNAAPTAEPSAKSETSNFIDTLQNMGVATGPEAIVGTTFMEKYDVLSFVGHGGMAMVYKVRHLASDTVMALKVLHENLWTDENSLKRFELEADSVARLSHPNLITLKDYGLTKDGVPYLVMDYLDGRNLTEAVEENHGLSLGQALAVFEQLCSGLRTAHEIGIVHRDLKPDNVMFLSSGGGYELKLVDFGIAKIITEDVDQAQHLTKTGEVFGSPLYMSPEQCLGKKIDQRTDIYALGCVMYFTLTSLPPLFGKDIIETMTKQVTDTPTAPSVVCPELNDPGKTQEFSLEDFEYVVLRCLEKKMEDRYSSLDEVLADLQKIKQKQPLDRKQNIAASAGQASAAPADSEGISGAYQVVEEPATPGPSGKSPIVIISIIVVVLAIIISIGYGLMR